MNVIGPIFAFVVVVMLLYFGMGATDDLQNQANNEVSNTSDMYDSLQTTNNLTQSAFTVMSVSPLLLILIAVIAMMLGLVTLLR